MTEIPRSISLSTRKTKSRCEMNNTSHVSSKRENKDRTFTFVPGYLKEWNKKYHRNTCIESVRVIKRELLHTQFSTNTCMMPMLRMRRKTVPVPASAWCAFEEMWLARFLNREHDPCIVDWWQTALVWVIDPDWQPVPYQVHTIKTRNNNRVMGRRLKRCRRRGLEDV